MLAGMRGFLGSVAQSAPPAGLLQSLRVDLDRWQEALAPHLTSDDDSPYGQFDDSADNGLASLPELTIHDETPESVDATVTFGRWFRLLPRRTASGSCAAGCSVARRPSPRPRIATWCASCPWEMPTRITRPRPSAGIARRSTGSSWACLPDAQPRSRAVIRSG